MILTVSRCLKRQWTGTAGVGGSCVSRPIHCFVPRGLQAALTANPSTESRLLISYDLLNSRFESSAERAFFLVMAIESQHARKDRQRSRSGRLFGPMVAASNLPTDRLEALKSGVGQLRWRSNATSCREYLRRAETAGILSDAGAAENYSRCYVIRSKMVHDGITPSASELANHSGSLESTSRELITALVERRWS
jgi:hypothetical protein